LNQSVEKQREPVLSAGRRLDSSNRSSRGPRKNGLVFAIIVGVIVLVLTMTALFAVYWYKGVYPNVTVFGTDIGGLSEAEAGEVIESVLATYTEERIKVSFKDEWSYIPIYDHDAMSSSSDILQNALTVGRTGNFFVRAKEIIKTLFVPYELMSEVKTDATAIPSYLESFKSTIERNKNEPRYKVLGDKLVIDLGIVGRTLDVESVVDIIEEHIQTSRGGEIDLEDYLVYDETTPLSILDIYNEIYVEPADAYLDTSEEVPKVVPHVVGVKFDLEKAERDVSTAEETTGSITIPLIITEPEITTEKFEALLFRDVLSEAKTTLNAKNLERTGNVRLSANSINGVILNPGDIFSYNETVGQRTYERGYRDASVYTSDGIEDQLGGGICQTSSTLYMNVIRAGLEIVERQNHAYTVIYAPLGEDATVYWGSIDFKFSNNQQFPVKIEAYQEKDYVVVRFLGTKLDNNTVKIETKVLEHTPYETFTEENPNLNYGVRRQKREGHSYYKIETYRVVYDENGREISREKLPSSRYRKLDRIMEIGTKGAPTVEPVETSPPVSSPSPSQPTTPEPSLPPETTPPNPTEPTQSPPSTRPEDPGEPHDPPEDEDIKDEHPKPSKPSKPGEDN
jgi:vancomycin resistance protein YoaR